MTRVRKKTHMKKIDIDEIESEVSPTGKIKINTKRRTDDTGKFYFNCGPFASNLEGAFWGIREETKFHFVWALDALAWCLVPTSPLEGEFLEKFRDKLTDRVEDGDVPLIEAFYNLAVELAGIKYQVERQMIADAADTTNKKRSAS